MGWPVTVAMALIVRLAPPARFSTTRTLTGNVPGLSGSLAGAVTRKFPPLAGAVTQEAVDVFVIFNALRAHLGPVGR